MFKTSSLLALAVAVVSSGAVAADKVSGGVIAFNGAITDTTCTVNINGGNSSDFTVALNPITVAEAGNTIGLIPKTRKSVALKFSDCSTASTSDKGSLKVYFSSADNISADGNYLMNTTVNEYDKNISKNVGFAFTAAGGSTPIKLNVPYDTKFSGDNKAAEGGAADVLSFDVYYYKTNAEAARVGALTSNLTYTVSYQ